MARERSGDRLTSERARVAMRIHGLQRDFDAIVAGSAGANLDDEHDPEGSTIGFERAQVAALLEQARAHLANIDDALLRRAEPDSGLCTRCGEPIASERLDALPTVTTCVTCAGATSPRARRARRAQCK